MLISEIFTSIDGESLRAGEVSTFIRTQGCPLRCKYCDSKYTWGKDDGVKEMSVYEIMNHLKEIDEVAYVRFASVYKQFKDVDTFMDELSKIIHENNKK